MPIQRQCPIMPQLPTGCGAMYPETATLCIACSDVPAALVPGTILTAALQVDSGATSIDVGNEILEVEKILGWGNMAIAMRVRTQSGKTLVVKEMLPNIKPKVQARLEQYFRREATMMYETGKKLATQPTAFPPFPVGYSQAYARKGYITVAYAYQRA